MKQITLKLDKNPVEGELLIFKDGIIKTVEIHELLPELLKLPEIDELKTRIEVLEAKVKELRGEDE